MQVPVLLQFTQPAAHFTQLLFPGYGPALEFR